MGGHRNLKAWQHAKVLAVECAKAARHLPQEERFALGDQLRRAAYGAALNIAEGAARSCLEARCDEAAKTLYGLIRSLDRRLNRSPSS